MDHEQDACVREREHTMRILLSSNTQDSQQHPFDTVSVLRMYVDMYNMNNEINVYISYSFIGRYVKLLP